MRLIIQFIISIAFFIQFGNCLSQNIAVKGGFLTDTIKVGLPVKYYLTAKHQSDKQLLFPDSSFSYYPFEFLKKEFFPTKTIKKISTDSVVYTLVSFETDLYQNLALPVFVINEKDCTAVFSKRHIVNLKTLIQDLPDLAYLKKSTDYQTVYIPEDFTKEYIFIGFIIILLSSIWILFGKRIRRDLLLYRLSLQHRGFVGNFERLRKRLKQENNVETVENAVVLWKKYMEDIEEKPFSTYTSKEIIEQIPDNNLLEALKDIDRVVYGQVISQQSAQSLDILETVSLKSYRSKREKVKIAFKS